MNRILRKYVCALILLAMNGLGMLLFHRFPGFFFPAYRRISRAWIGFLAQLTSFTRVSVWDILAALLFLTLLFSLNPRGTCPSPSHSPGTRPRHSGP